MKDEFIEYLKDISFPVEFIPRVEYVVQFYNTTLKIPINQVLVTDYIAPDGQRVFDNLWILNDNYMMEAKNFIHSNDFDCAVYNSVEYWNIRYFDFDLVNVSEKSKLLIDMTLTCSGQGTRSQFKATGKNCLHIFNYFKKEIPKRLENYCAQHRV